MLDLILALIAILFIASGSYFLYNGGGAGGKTTNIASIVIGLLIGAGSYYTYIGEHCKKV
jgi:hypothetical protein